MAEQRARRGFTLLEVMAAVAVLGLVTVVLARLQAQGAMAEGEARRRMEASLRADRVLADLEATWAAGAPIAPDRREAREDGFDVVVDVAPFEAERFGLADLLAEPGADAPRGAPELPPVGPPALLTAEGRRAPPVFVVTVTVSWLEGAEELATTRTTFAFDRQAAAPLLEPVAGQDGGPGAPVEGSQGLPTGEEAPPPDRGVPR